MSENLPMVCIDYYMATSGIIPVRYANRFNKRVHIRETVYSNGKPLDAYDCTFHYNVECVVHKMIVYWKKVAPDNTIEIIND